MQIGPFIVDSEKTNEYDGKKGHVVQVVAVLRDGSKGGNRLGHYCEHVLNPEDKVALAGKLQDKVVTIDCNRVETFAGAVRLHGKLKVA